VRSREGRYKTPEAKKEREKNSQKSSNSLVRKGEKPKSNSIVGGEVGEEEGK